MGKQLVPILRSNGTLRARFSGRDHAFDPSGVPEFTAALARAGAYWREMDPDEYAAAAADPLVQEGMFQEEAARRLGDWLAFAEDRLAGTSVRLYLMGG